MVSKLYDNYQKLQYDKWLKNISKIAYEEDYKMPTEGLLELVDCNLKSFLVDNRINRKSNESKKFLLMLKADYEELDLSSYFGFNSILISILIGVYSLLLNALDSDIIKLMICFLFSCAMIFLIIRIRNSHRKLSIANKIIRICLDILEELEY